MNFMSVYALTTCVHALAQSHQGVLILDLCVCQSIPSKWAKIKGDLRLQGPTSSSSIGYLERLSREVMLDVWSSDEKLRWDEMEESGREGDEHRWEQELERCWEGPVTCAGGWAVAGMIVGGRTSVGGSLYYRVLVYICWNREIKSWTHITIVWHARASGIGQVSPVAHQVVISSMQFSMVLFSWWILLGQNGNSNSKLGWLWAPHAISTS